MVELMRYIGVLNLLLVFFSPLVFLLIKTQKWAFSDLLKLTYLLLTSLFLCPLLTFIPRTLPVAELSMSIPISNKPSFAMVPLLFLILLMFNKTRELFKLYKILKSSYTIRSFRSVRILISQHIAVPFSLWVPFRTYVVLSEEILLEENFKIFALLHELQHHRQKDTKWVYPLHLLKLFCFFNPFFYLFEKHLSELQECACDEHLVGRRDISSSAYCRCLLWVAQRSLRSPKPAGASLGMANGFAKTLIQRRIEFMLHAKARHFRRSLLFLIGIFSFGGILGLAHASSVSSNPVSYAEAKKMLANVRSEFPVRVNDLVLKQLNYYLGTAEGQAIIHNGIEQMRNHESTVMSALDKYHLPRELAAVPLVESGYQNLPQNRTLGAGIWQFITSTAIDFGLNVTATEDQRLDVEEETDAAMRLISALNLQLKSIELAMLGFNAGSQKVVEGIKNTKSRDVWTLIRGGYQGDEDYFAKLVAVILILKNKEIF